MRWINTLDRAIQGIVLLLFSALLLVVVFQIVIRFLPVTVLWTEEITRYLFVYTIAFAAPLALYRKEFIKVDFIYSFLSAKQRAVYETIVHTLIGIVAAYLVVEGINFYLLGTFFSSPASGIPMQYVYAAVPVLGLLLLCYSVLFVISQWTSTNIEAGEK
ncbi:hypothetical protein CHL76_11260 [Marinococcus halophilus]|uniref:Tripartite ATP-independent periplasmic transporters DctQ component domain-containing protein n=1 Tax=Marinococcus halophilus TaxID=1371 RepID=A0A510Y7B3_MARHA|nr:TRAP transporter small permease [Marinococcus halophilus]OZT79707.1 hypothetical protein CHL76_11260 [Marinococcus halophilus]GEK59063.1 hypothetical protein MHA01_19680 [Marinococcus halophilus]